jgi:adenylosuccinate synthase
MLNWGMLTPHSSSLGFSKSLQTSSQNTCLMQERGYSSVTELSESSLIKNSVPCTNGCSVVLDLHQKVDGLEEVELGGGKIGTTGKGNH